MDPTPKQENSKFKGKIFVWFIYLLSTMEMWVELQRNLGVTKDNAKHIQKPKKKKQTNKKKTQKKKQKRKKEEAKSQILQ